MAQDIRLQVSDETVQGLKIGETVRAVIVGTVESLEGSEQLDPDEGASYIGVKPGGVIPACVEITVGKVSVVSADAQMETLMTGEEGD